MHAHIKLYLVIRTKLQNKKTFRPSIGFKFISDYSIIKLMNNFTKLSYYLIYASSVAP